MQSSTQYSFAFLLALCGILSGCCGVQRQVGCGSCGVTGACNDACPGLLHGELAGRIRDAITGGCCSGCGEVYYDEQINEPPTCDPCSGSGEFTGTSCGPCRPLFQRLRELWCTPCGTGCGSGCESCGTCMQPGTVARGIVRTVGMESRGTQSNIHIIMYSTLLRRMRCQKPRSEQTKARRPLPEVLQARRWNLCQIR